MRVFAHAFNKYGIPVLFIGSLGAGINLYLRGSGYDFFSLNSNNSGDNNASTQQGVTPTTTNSSKEREDSSFSNIARSQIHDSRQQH